MFKRFSKITGIVVPLFFMTSCSTIDVSYPNDIKDSLPIKTPVKNITGFTDGLMCMDSMFVQYKVKPILITAAQIPDFSESRGAAGYGAREMLISAISAMSQKSGSLRFIAYDRSTPDIIALQSAHPRKNEFLVPDFFIRGAITQIDKTPYSKQAGYSLSGSQLWEEQSIHGAQLSNSNSATLTSMGVDLNLGLINNFEILPGISSSNSFAVDKRSKSDDVSLNIWKLGAVYTLSESRAQALSSGLRALMEVGAIELFGKLYNVPYWQCLGMLGDDSESDRAAKEKYKNMNKKDTAQWVAEQLQRLNYMDEGVELYDDDKKISDEFKTAISHFRVKNNLFGNTLINFNLFKKLYVQYHLDQKALGPVRAVTSSPLKELSLGKNKKKSKKKIEKEIVPEEIAPEKILPEKVTQEEKQKK